jgi:MFS family permease
MRRLVSLASIVVLVDTMFYAAITPLLPHYAADLHLSKAAAGVLTAAYAAGTLLGSFPGGWLAAKYGSKRAAIIGLVLLSVSGLVFGFGRHIAVLDAARFLQGVGGAFSWTGMLSWLVAASSGGRGRLIGSAMASAIAGVVLGPALGGMAVLISPEVVFSGIALLGAGLCWWASTTPAPPPSIEPRSPGAKPILGRPLLTAFCLVLLPAQYSGLLSVLVPLRFDDLGATGLVIGAAFVVAGIVEAVTTRFYGGFSDRRGRMLPISAGLLASAVTAALMPLPDSVLLLAAALFLAVVGTGTLWAPATALLSDSADRQGLEQGYAFALVNLAWAAGEIIGSAGGSGLAELAGDALPYLICSSLFVVALLILRLRPAVHFPEPADDLGRRGVVWRSDDQLVAVDRDDPPGHE